tara:strand:+ start:1658 stop:1768 length:111 start_codon:yes stop_codon:yes gene_type:complete
MYGKKKVKKKDQDRKKLDEMKNKAGGTGSGLSKGSN